MSNLSKCCNSMVKVGHDPEGTQFYVCMKCNKPCDVEPERKKAPITVSSPIFTIKIFGYCFALGKIVKEFDDIDDLDFKDVIL